MGVINNIKGLINYQKVSNNSLKKLYNETVLSNCDRVALHFNFRKEDIFIASYPKSGNTWTRFIVANLLQKEEEITFRNIEAYVPDIHKSYDLAYKKKGHRFIKSHYQHFYLLPKFIYIIRDGRDAAVSFYHYESGCKKFNGTFSEFLRSDVIKVFGHWQNHVEEALSHYYNQPDKVLLLKYEEMIADLPLIIEKIAQFCKIRANSEKIARVAGKCTFEALRENEEKFGSEILDMKNLFFRRGTSNQWREYFSATDHEYFLSHNREMLVKNGYNVNY